MYGCPFFTEARPRFNAGAIPGGMGSLTTPGRSARGAVGDTARQTLYVADGTAGLTVVDLLSPGGSVDLGNVRHDAEGGVVVCHVVFE